MLLTGSGGMLRALGGGKKLRRPRKSPILNQVIDTATPAGPGGVIAGNNNQLGEVRKSVKGLGGHSRGNTTNQRKKGGK
jgi:hypothetical protein